MTAKYVDQMTTKQTDSIHSKPSKVDTNGIFGTKINKPSGSPVGKTFVLTPA
jgi:hypothetical protein